MRGAHTAYAGNAHGLCGERTRLMRAAHTAYAESAHGLCGERTRRMLVKRRKRLRMLLPFCWNAVTNYRARMESSGNPFPAPHRPTSFANEFAFRIVVETNSPPRKLAQLFITHGALLAFSSESILMKLIAMPFSAA